MKPRHSIQQEMSQVTGLIRCYFKGRLQNEPIQNLNLIIHDLRLMLHQLITDYFMLLPLEEAKRFRLVLADHLANVCGEFYGGGSIEDEEHSRYCIQEVLSCFEWAEQIKEEIPDDPVTQRVLALDIPILRPFNYHHGRKKGVVRPARKS